MVKVDTTIKQNLNVILFMFLGALFISSMIICILIFLLFPIKIILFIVGLSPIYLTYYFVKTSIFES